jgi:hypothetical protein
MLFLNNIKSFVISILEAYFIYIFLLFHSRGPVAVCLGSLNTYIGLESFIYYISHTLTTLHINGV